MKKLTTEEFISKARKVHGDKYDYSKVNYVNAKTKVCIICPIHGEFWQTPDTHLNGGGCFKCAHSSLGLRKRKTNEEFIQMAKKTHQNKYIYTKTNYINALTKVCIICPKHGEFWQAPNSHLDECGCPMCKGENLHTERNKGKQAFVEKAKNVHGNKYDYTKVIYNNSNTKVCIICPIHGEFWQTPHNHLNGKGCPHCAINRKMSTEEFKTKYYEKYGNKISLEKSVYRTSKEKITVTCHVHGDFETTPDNLLHGHGCPKCKESKLENYLREVLEKNSIAYEYQKRFKWLGRQSLDFYIPSKNIAIECQGIQHYQPVDFGGKGTEWANKLFEKNKKRDRIKLEKVKSNGIKMIYVNEKNKNNFLNEIL